MARRLEITISEELWDRLNEARGHEPRASFVKRALESALGSGAPDSYPPAPTPTSTKMPSEPPADFGIPEKPGKPYELPKIAPRKPR